jgi:hypothetical protein
LGFVTAHNDEPRRGRLAVIPTGYIKRGINRLPPSSCQLAILINADGHIGWRRALNLHVTLTGHVPPDFGTGCQLHGLPFDFPIVLPTKNLQTAAQRVPDQSPARRRRLIGVGALDQLNIKGDASGRSADGQMRSSQRSRQRKRNRFHDSPH